MRKRGQTIEHFFLFQVLPAGYKLLIPPSTSMGEIRDAAVAAVALGREIEVHSTTFEQDLSPHRTWTVGETYPVYPLQHTP